MCTKQWYGFEVVFTASTKPLYLLEAPERCSDSKPCSGIRRGSSADLNSFLSAANGLTQNTEECESSAFSYS